MELSLLTRREPATLLRSGRLDGVLVAVFAIAVSAAGAARPSLWFDEAATISASTRTIPELVRLLGNIDAVHGAYYLLMHGWFAVFPATEFWSRFSSCLAVGLAAAGVVALGRRFVGRSAAVTAGVVFAILPRVTWAGIEARSYALTAAAAVWLTVLLVAACRRPRLWVAYGAGLVLAAVLNVFMVLLVLPHAVFAATLRDRRSTAAWAGAAAAAVLTVAPLLLFCRTQIAQVRWISPLSARTVGEILKEQYFDDSLAFAVCAGFILLLPLAFRRLRPAEPGARRLLRLCAAWAVLPTAMLLLYSIVAEPIYYPRYLTYTSPAMALLLGVSIVGIVRARERATAVLAVLAVAATPNFLMVQRGPYAKEGMDFSQVADVITAHAATGDCLIMDNTTNWMPGPIRPLTAARPAAYAKLIDPGRGMRAADRNRLWDAHLGIWGVADRVRACTVLWTVSQRDRAVPDRQSGAALDPGPRLRRAPAYQVPERMGFHIVERWQFNFAQVVKSMR
ncbi:glycosyltransferase family 39 protein [Mycolicibacterium cosmeticum]|uniref:Transmembrane protein n=1 Tax=Mycolicibacterium cosmeticum TaxID=258533 RepID=W9AKU0_MYCCO|nr:glycosyltransferase family 39 protein [Mycolicibacterium cosmeticum]CDO06339.1 transmembrane protein [Mycolicibacterium cosmeticum]